jgi:hypothetical protein
MRLKLNNKESISAKKKDTKTKVKKKEDGSDKKSKKVDEESKKEMIERKTVISHGVMVDHKVPTPEAYEVIISKGTPMVSNLV